jgi:hypothetical protein
MVTAKRLRGDLKTIKIGFRNALLTLLKMCVCFKIQFVNNKKTKTKKNKSMKNMYDVLALKYFYQENVSFLNNSHFIAPVLCY